MSEAALQALMQAALCDMGRAMLVLTRLEDQGFTVYRKKVFTNGRRPNTSETMTPALAKAIRTYHGVYPDTTQQEIANVFNVNIGRVNEALKEAL